MVANLSATNHTGAAFERETVAFRQPRAVADLLGPLIQLFTFVVLISTLGRVGFVIGASLFGVVLLAIANGKIIILPPHRRALMRLAIFVVYATTLTLLYALAQSLLSLTGMTEMSAHVFSCCAAYSAAFGAHVWTTPRLLSRLGRRE